MAIKPFSRIDASQSYSLIVWRDLGADDEGLPFDCFESGPGSGWAHFYVHVDGIFSPGAELTIFGSLIPEKFAILKAFSTDGYEEIMAADLIKPVVDGGDSETKISVGLLAIR